MSTNSATAVLEAGPRSIDLFGLLDWQTYHNIVLSPAQVTTLGPFPWSDAVLNSRCPFHNGKMVRETHFAFAGLDTITITELHSYADTWYANEQFATTVTLGLRWYLLLKDIVPDSEGKKFAEQVAMLPAEYEAPSAVAETAKDLFVKTKTGVFVNPNRYARTSDPGSGGSRVSVGVCVASGVDVHYFTDDYRNGHIGVGASRKFEKTLVG